MKIIDVIVIAYISGIIISLYIATKMYNAKHGLMNDKTKDLPNSENKDGGKNEN